MEDSLHRSLGLEAGAQVLDAGCGAGLVASHLAKKGLRIQGIDIIDRHVKWAQQTVEKAGLTHAVQIQRGDYHSLSAFSPNTFDGAYTMETFVHAADPAKALGEFFRVLQPGGSIAFYEYDHINLANAPRDLVASMEKVNRYAAMPTNVMFDRGALPALLKEAGFVDVAEKDLSANIKPMLWLFFVLAYIPYLLVTFLGLEPWFINTVAAVQSYRGRHIWRYVATTAKKPGVRCGNRDEQERQYWFCRLWCYVFFLERYSGQDLFAVARNMNDFQRSYILTQFFVFIAC